RRDGVDLMDGARILGAASDTLTITGVVSADAGDYRVVVSNVMGSDTSVDATLTVPPLPECSTPACHPVLVCVLGTVNDGTSCNDGCVCTQGETCASGVCAGGGPKDADSDARVDAACGGTDCNDADSFVWSSPAEVANLHLTTVFPAMAAWNSQAV